jgi:SAM-dependent methyltransferase
VRRTVDVLEELVPLEGRTVVDVGCGIGALVRTLTRKGAHAIGVEVQTAQLERARAAEPAGDEEYLEGVGEDLPLADASADAVVFFQSLHHVPAAHMRDALAEAARVVRPDGLVLVAEPIAEGAFFELVRPLDDETEVRRLAYEALRAAPAAGLEIVEELELLNPITFADFHAFRAVVVGADGDRAPVFERVAPELQKAFEATGRRTDDGWAFESPTRVTLLRRA